MSVKESRELKNIFEQKYDITLKEYNALLLDYQEAKREIVGFNEVKKERDERIEKLKEDLEEMTNQFKDNDRQLTTLNIQHEKATE